MEIFRVAIDGGDVSGKSSCEDCVREELEKCGLGVIFIPEVATRLIRQYGINPKKLSDKQFFDFEELILKTYIEEEDKAAENAAKLKGVEKVVIIGDRGVMSVKAYLRKPEDFTTMLRRNGWNVVQLRDLRYDLVCHLVTAADGLPEIYNREVSKNPARHGRPLLEALRIDGDIQAAWTGHSRFCVIDNSTDFKGKKRRLVEVIKRGVGLPNKLEVEKKLFVHHPVDLRNFPVSYQEIHIDQAYLDDSGQHRVRRRIQDGEGIVYYKTQKLPTDSLDSSVEIERLISYNEFMEGFNRRNSKFKVVSKKRIYFIWKGQYFELDIFQSPARLKEDNLQILELEIMEPNRPIEWPPWLCPMTEVTYDPKYKNKNLARE